MFYCISNWTHNHILKVLNESLDKWDVINYVRTVYVSYTVEAPHGGAGQSQKEVIRSGSFWHRAKLKA
jgi:hypothetical protein